MILFPSTLFELVKKKLPRSPALNILNQFRSSFSQSEFSESVLNVIGSIELKSLNNDQKLLYATSHIIFLRSSL
jgi:cell division protein FtsI/penicillin-binding protein 2